MERTLSVSALAACPFSIAEDYAIEFLRHAESGGEEAAIRLPLPQPLPPLRRVVALTFALHFDVEEAGRRHDEVRLRWDSGTSLLPDFHGTIRFRIEGASTRIIIGGSYTVPLGALGRLFDAVLGRHIASATLRDLAERLATTLAERERAWRRGAAFSPA